MAWLVKFGGTTIGTEMLFELPDVERRMPPVEEVGHGRDVALLVEQRANVIWRPRFVVYHEEADPWLFADWLIATGRYLSAGRADVTVYDDAALKRTYPQCALLRYGRPQPRSPAESMFSAEVSFDFVTDQEPF